MLHVRTILKEEANVRGSETLAAVLWPGEDAVGKRMKWRTDIPDSPLITIIGVAADAKAGALLATQLMQSLLYEVSPRDPVALALVAATLLVVAGLAAIAPARRATASDPMLTLRSE